MEHEDLYDLIPAYALDALDPDEKDRFEAWLRAHPDAQSLLDDYRQVADHLVMMAPVQPAPAHLQADLRARLAAERSSASPTAVSAPEPPPTLSNAGRTLRLHRRWRRTALLTAAAVVLVIVAGLVLIRPAAAPAENAAEAYARIAAEDGAGWFDVVPGDVSDAVTGDLVVTPDGGEAVIRVAQLPPIERDQTFQLWLVDQSGSRVSGGLFRPGTDDATYIRVPLDRPVADYQAFGVSLEPDGGSPLKDAPTGPRVFLVPLSS
ncbi:MAG TPA: anti-sigma factor [Aggregatilinea sp.]|uniref:anti-sigma factor n=1 Tax=Aggregatilinea sp. TaxID=2806333 RepID=UPI002BEE018C|nr:anti-sigma factor [Aggregatilinea sp.]HML21534.1 anti-sigma factor [Aggregatilinea sp.]